MMRMIIFAAAFLLPRAAGQIDVFCYNIDGDDPKRIDYPAYSDGDLYRLTGQGDWSEVSVVRCC